MNIKFFNKRRWKLSSEIVSDFKPYEVVDNGLTWIDPKKILGLCHPSKEVKNDSKMQELRDSVNINGWNDKCPHDLHLYYLPNKKFTVATGGNHRSYLSNELNIPKIQAYVTIVLPFTIIPEELIAKLEYLYLKEEIYENEAAKINEWLKQKGHRRYDYPESSVYNKLCDLADQMADKRKECLLSFANSIDMMPIDKK
jgi:hypothetical protein